jgi:putative redox protein
MGAIGILKKMRVPDFELNIDVEAEQTTEHPKVFSEITVVYNFTGENLESAKLHKAVSVAEERFCGVNLMLSKTARINSLIKLNGDLV